MTRGPGRIERAIEAVLRDADRSYSIDELAQIAYGTAEVEKKHRVAVLRALRGVGRRVPLWHWITDQRRGSYFVTRLEAFAPTPTGYCVGDGGVPRARYNRSTRSWPTRKSAC